MQLQMKKISFRFSSLTWCAEQLASLEAQSSTKKKEEILKKALASQPKKTQTMFLNFLLAQLGNPNLLTNQFMLPEEVIYSSLSKNFNIPIKEVRKLDGDISHHLQVTQFYSSLPRRQPVPLELLFQHLNELSDTKGTGSQSLKTDLLNKLINLCQNEIELKYLVRFLQKTMRVGVSQKIVSKIVDEATNIQVLGFQKSSLEFGIPVIPMLAKSFTSANELVDDFILKQTRRNPQLVHFCEYKYDGERLQVHYRKGEVQLFGRSLECKTKKYPKLVTQLLETLGSIDELESVIFDCEMICYKDGLILPFQEMQHKDFENSEQISLVCFDIIMLNEANLINQKYSSRIEIYRKLLNPISKERSVISHITQQQYSNIGQLQEYFQMALDDGLEGLMIKRDTEYKTGARTDWAKLKLEKDADLALIGAYYGKGKRMNVFGAYLLGVYQPEGEIIYPITKIGTGFSEAQLRELTEKYEKRAVRKPFGVEDVQPEPDVWFPTGTVWEVNYDIISLSPTYNVKNDRFQGGLSFRFPRFVREREDKSIKDCMTVDEIIDLYLKRQL